MVLAFQNDFKAYFFHKNDASNEIRFELIHDLLQRESEYTILMNILHEVNKSTT